MPPFPSPSNTRLCSKHVETRKLKNTRTFVRVAGQTRRKPLQSTPHQNQFTVNLIQRSRDRITDGLTVNTVNNLLVAQVESEQNQFLILSTKTICYCFKRPIFDKPFEILIKTIFFYVYILRFKLN